MSNIDRAISTLQKGEMIILVDDQDRENEGDLVIAAEHITPEAINFMLHHARGVVCLSMTPEKALALGLERLSSRRAGQHSAPFAMSFDAADGVTTGVSAMERAYSIKLAASDDAVYQDLTTPGHIFPLIADPNGVLSRRGHTEGSVDLMRLANLKKSAVICEILNPDGSMARKDDLKKMSSQYNLPMVSIEDIAHYRKTHETCLQQTDKAKLPTKEWGDLMIEGFFNPIDNSECIAIYPYDFVAIDNTLVRVHSSCLTGDLLQSLRCDCGSQFRIALQRIIKEKGVLIYLNQEGRGIGLTEKIKAYVLQEQGLDTVEANIKLGFKADERDFWMAAQVLKKMTIPSIRLLTNNQNKMEQLISYGINITVRVPLLTKPVEYNVNYLKTKQQKLGHQLAL